MSQLLEIFGFASVLLRGLALSFEALVVGGVVFLPFVSRSPSVRRPLACFAGCLIAVEVCRVGLNGAILAGTTGMGWGEIAGARFCASGGLVLAGAAGVILFGRSQGRGIALALSGSAIVAGSVMCSHSFGRVEHRWLAMALTAAHHLAGAAWIGGLFYLLIALRALPEKANAAIVTARFSRLAMVSVPALAAAGAGLGALYVGSPAALTGTTYGIMLVSKVALTATALLLGALNLKIVRVARSGNAAGLLPLRRFGEAELGIGFTILLAAASLTSTPPAIDVRENLVPGRETLVRMKPAWPRMQTPAVGELSPATPLRPPESPRLPGSFLPGERSTPDTPADIAWSEYNHHWAGMVMLAVGALALLSRRAAWARVWPLAFLGLAAFLFRADSENWPLGPRGFWESFQVAEVTQHRFFVLLIILFAIFEWAVQNGRLPARRAGLVFPLVCAAGGSLLMTHEHSLGNVKQEFFAETQSSPAGRSGGLGRVVAVAGNPAGPVAGARLFVDLARLLPADRCHPDDLPRNLNSRQKY